MVAIFLYEIDQGPSVVHRCRGQDAMAEIENMTRWSGLLENVCRGFGEIRGCSKQRTRIQISLNRNPVPYASHRFCDWHSPVDAENFRSGIRHGFENVGAAVDIKNARHAVPEFGENALN